MADILSAAALIDELNVHANAKNGEFANHFFKTKKGQYGAGDVFIGVTVPQTRAICRKFKGMPLPEIQKLLQQDVHEYRLAALILLVTDYAKATSHGKTEIYNFYLQNLRDGRINNWDLVDASAYQIVGEYLMHSGSHAPLVMLAKQPNLWERRVAIVSTFAFLRHGQSQPTIEVATLLLHDKEDLIHKAVGWMLREMGKKVGQPALIEFLEQHAATMPRTALRYAIERLTPAQRADFMQRKNKLAN